MGTRYCVVISACVLAMFWHVNEFEAEEIMNGERLFISAHERRTYIDVCIVSCTILHAA